MRAVPEWIGANDDTPAPARVRLRVFERCQGKCGICDRSIRAGERWTLEHVIAICNGGPNAESNLDITCCNCLAAKNAADVAEKAKIARVRSKHIGIKATSRHPMPGSRRSRFKRKLDGTTILR